MNLGTIQNYSLRQGVQATGISQKVGIILEFYCVMDVKINYTKILAEFQESCYFHDLPVNAVCITSCHSRSDHLISSLILTILI